MTQLQEIMLAVCFGSVIGAFLGNLISIIVYAASGCGQMKRRRKTAQEAAEARYQRALAEARRVNGQEDRPRSLPDDDWLLARNA